jgi:hypothetical protein
VTGRRRGSSAPREMIINVTPGLFGDYFCW